MPTPFGCRRLVGSLSAASCLLLVACQGAPAFVPPPFGIATTEDPLHLSIDNQGDAGGGYDHFVLTDPAGTRFYTRHGAFRLDATRTMVHAPTGFMLVPRVTFPVDATDIHIREDGLVLYRRPGSVEHHELDVITTARFARPQGLTPLTKDLFLASTLSGPLAIGRPATRGFGPLRQGALEIPDEVVVPPDSGR